MPHRFHHIPRPRLAFGANHGGPFADPPQRFAQVAAAAHKRHFKALFVDMKLFVSGRQHFRLVDIVDPNRFQNLRLYKMPDPALRHHWNGNRLFNPDDQLRIAHARHAPLRANVGGYPF